MSKSYNCIYEDKDFDLYAWTDCPKCYGRGYDGMLTRMGDIEFNEEDAVPHRCKCVEIIITAKEEENDRPTNPNHS